MDDSKNKPAPKFNLQNYYFTFPKDSARDVLQFLLSDDVDFYGIKQV